MPTPTRAFTTTDLSRSTRDVINQARATGAAFVRDGDDGMLFGLVPSDQLENLEEFRRYADTLIPLSVRGVESDHPSDYSGVSWLARMPADARRQFLNGALECLLMAVDGDGFGPLRMWFEDWRLLSDLERAGITQRMREGTVNDTAVEGRPRRRR